MADLSRVHIRSPIGEIHVSEGDQWSMTLTVVIKSPVWAMHSSICNLMRLRRRVKK